MARLINSDSSIVDVFPKNKRKGFTLKELYEIIGCEMVEVVSIPLEGMIMIVDEEGRLKENARFNFAASIVSQNTIFGNAVVCAEKDFK